jgi:DNA-binding HxlR family transcriptional regulator
MRCSVARALSAVGDRWTVLILREAFLGVKRFELFRERLSIARNILTSRLQELVREGILQRTRYQEKPERFEYRLTEKGIGLYPVLVTLMAWGDRWMCDEMGPPMLLVHKPCEHTLAPVVTCSHCGQLVGPRDVRTVAGPGLAARAGWNTA